MENKYLHYKVEDFVQDSFFRNWVSASTEQHHAFWTAWLELHPEKKPTIEEARIVLQSLNAPEYPSLSDHLKDDWQRIEAAINKDETANRAKVYSLRPRWYTIAAVVLLLIAAGMALWWLTFANAWTNVQTDFGQTHTVQLADGSEVVLNANSQLRYASSWQDITHEREVWLEGEAYFSVVRTATSQKFVVHLNDIKIDVLGTKFNVLDRPERTQVVLSEGKVKLQAKHAGKADTVVMQPGELVEYAHQEQIFLKKEVQPATYSSWRNGLLVFNQATLNEVIAVLENNYGYHVKLKNPVWGTQRVTVKVASDEVNLLLKLLAESFDFVITQQNKTITINKRQVQYQ